ncbi:BQ2448_3973 [Microbotryum intermedium]|uniref:BQ2448_3973 protein n=1 Tax=Microbotryum intermedium TaxID=269621 RepID=A0A238FMX5_9BASI|nr:BQ2448_3973 [Microbotryum intermedium]
MPSTSASRAARPTHAFDPTKPVLVVISPIVSLSASAIPQIQDGQIRSSFNIVSIDPRSHGRSRGAIKSTYDRWTAAADVACVMEALQLPPSHVYAPSSPCFQIALNLAIFFPELISRASCPIRHEIKVAHGFDFYPQVLSLSFAAVTGLYALPKSLPQTLNLEQSWQCPLDSEEFEEALGGLGQSFAPLTLEYGRGASGQEDHNLFSGYDGPEMVQIVDKTMGVISRRYNQYKAVRTFEVCRENQYTPQPSPLGPASVRVPVLIMHGTKDLTSSVEEANEVRQALTQAQVEFHEIEGGPNMIFLTHAAETTTLLRSFLTRHTSSVYGTDFVVTASSPPATVNYDRALLRAAKLSNNSLIKRREPRIPDSFSLVSVTVKDESTRQIDRLQKRAGVLRFVIPGMDDPEPWEANYAQKRPWRWSQRHVYTGPAGGVRTSVASEIEVQVAIQQAREEHRMGVSTTHSIDEWESDDGSESSDMVQTPESQGASPRFHACFVPTRAGGDEGLDCSVR